MQYDTVRIDPKTNLPRVYRVTNTKRVKVRAHDPQDRTVAECINAAQSKISLNGTITGLPYRVTGMAR